jgi:NAD+ synthase
MSEKLNKIIAWMQDFKEKNNVKGVVLGLSGGKDSTVVSMLAKKVFGDNVLAVSMPNGDQKDISDVQDIAKTLNLNIVTVNIKSTFDQLIKDTCVDISEKAKTNIAPRLRMTVLYGIAQSMGYLVIGTGNKSEAMIGWTTKFGDSACDFNPIGHLTCREVIEIGKELAEEFGLDINYIVKKPADGLTSKTDEDNFGFTYDELDDYLMYGIEGPNIDKIENMIIWADHKRKMPPKVESYTVLVRGNI